MSISRFIWAIIIGTAMAMIGWVLVLFKVDPERASFLALGAFYSLLFLIVLGIIFLLGIAIRNITGHIEVAHRRVQDSLRQAIIAAGVVVLWSLLQAHSLGGWWTTSLVIALALMVEFFMITRRGYVMGYVQQH